MNTREALTQRIRTVNDRIDRLQLKINQAKSERAELIAQRDALTLADEDKLLALQAAGVLKVED